MQATTAELRGHRARWLISDMMPIDLRDRFRASGVMSAHLLYCRGYTEAEAIELCLEQALIDYDPFLMPDVREAVARIESAVSNHERVAVYGDFDCDGMTAAAALVETLSAYGLDPLVYIPERDAGHGLTPQGLAALSEADVTLIVTADCGIGAVEEVEIAKGMGMDVVVTDHHQPRADGVLPDCPVVSPTRHDSQYPFPFLCGAGVVYKLAQALHASHPGNANPDDLLDLVGLATIADVVPLLDENRSLAIRGLRSLQSTTRPGLLALFAACEIEPSRVDATSVGFYVAPRLNAANRMATPRLAYDLITASDAAAATPLAAHLSALNGQRQTLVTRHLQRLLSEIGDAKIFGDEVRAGKRSPIVIAMGDWPPGISGLLASKLVDTYGVPAFVGSTAGTETTSVSARGTALARIDEILEECAAAHEDGLFLGYGGHAGAGGFRIATTDLERARESLESASRHHVTAEHTGKTLIVDAEVPLRVLHIAAVDKVRELAPFGNGFPEPLFLTRGVTVVKAARIPGGEHVRLTVAQNGIRMPAVCFGAGSALLQIPLGSRIDIVFHVDINEWQGMRAVELRIRDWRFGDTR